MGILRQDRVFLLSPAHCGGRRAQQLLSPGAAFPLAQELASRRGAALGDLFAFVSGLYFRGKVAYARRFAAPPRRDGRIRVDGVHLITPNLGLLGLDRRVGRQVLRGFARTSIDPNNGRYRRPLERSARSLRRAGLPDVLYQ